MNLKGYFINLSIFLSGFLFFMGLFLLIAMNNQPGTLFPQDSFLEKLVSPYRGGSESVNILVLGVDKVGANTDTMMVVNFNPYNAKVSILSIPRDTKVNFNGGARKINSTYSAGGSPLAITSAEGLLNLEIKYYVVVKLSILKDVVDQLGGVDYDVPVNMDYDDPTQDLHIHIRKGQQHFDGALAEQFIRFRQPNTYNDEIMKYYDGSDLKRIDAQQSFLKELLGQKLNVLNIGKLNGVIRSVFNNIETDITMNDLSMWMGSLSKFKPDEMQLFKLPGTADEGGSYFYNIDSTATAEITGAYFQTGSGLAVLKGVKAPSASSSGVTPGKAGTSSGNGNASPNGNVPANGNENQSSTTQQSYTDKNPSNGETGFSNILNEAP